MLDILINNPYRILGVYSNSTKKEIVTNKSKISAFIKVGKQISFPMDLSHFLGVPSRSEDSISKADSELTLQVDQIKYAQFWFLKTTPLDDIAFNKLAVGDIDSAIDIWSKKENCSSLQNKIVCALIQARYQEAVIYAARLYNLYADGFQNYIIDGFSSFSKEDFVKSFIDSLVENQEDPLSNNYLDLKAIAISVKDPIWKDYINFKILTPLLEKMEDAITIAKESRKNDPTNGIEISKKLRTQVSCLLSHIKDILNKEDLKYQLIADKAGLEILQCAIDGYNKSDDVHAVAKETLSLFEYANSIVIGENAKNRCADNIKIVKKIVEELPPKEIESEVLSINRAISLFCKQPDEIKYAVKLVNTCKPLLTSIADRVGRDSAMYINLSTRVADNALYNLIEEVNSVQKKYPYSENPQIWSFNLARIKYTLSEACKAMLLIDSLHMDVGFKTNKWNPSKRKLSKLCDDYGVFDSSLQMRSTTAHSSHTSAPFQTPQHSYSSRTSSANNESNNVGCWIGGIALFVIVLLCMVTCSDNKLTTMPSGPITTSSHTPHSTDSVLSNPTISNSNSSSNSKTTYRSPFSTKGSGSLGVDLPKINIPDPIVSTPSYKETILRTGQYPFGANKFDQSSLSELTIDNQSDIDAVVVLENMSGKWIRNVFVGKRSSFTMTKIPYGMYIMKTMRGSSWNAEKNNGTNHPKGGFMKNCSYSKSEWNDPFDFRSKETYEGISYPTYSVTLHTVVNGNFHTEATTSEDFFE